MADGNESNVLLLKEAGGPIEVIYAAEGTPSIVQPSAVFAAAPHPRAARLFQNYLFGEIRPTQFADQLISRRIEQIGKTSRRVFALHHLGIVGNYAQ